jgi:AcrR family transcriptional regulator
MLAMSEKRGRGRPPDARIEGAVVDATLAEIAEKGLRNATMEGIAVRAEIGKATLYRRWPSKEALLYFLADQLSETYDVLDTGDLRKDLLSVFEPLAKLVYAGPVATLTPTFIAEAARDPQIREYVSNLVTDRRKGARLALRRAQKRGELRRGVDLDMVLDMMHGALDSRFLSRGLPVTESHIRKVLDLALEGVLARESADPASGS